IRNYSRLDEFSDCSWSAARIRSSFKFTTDSRSLRTKLACKRDQRCGQTAFALVACTRRRDRRSLTTDADRSEHVHPALWAYDSLFCDPVLRFRATGAGAAPGENLRLPHPRCRRVAWHGQGLELVGSARVEPRRVDPTLLETGEP